VVDVVIFHLLSYGRKDVPLNLARVQSLSRSTAVSAC
jgi:hypothetical protein